MPQSHAVLGIVVLLAICSASPAGEEAGSLPAELAGAFAPPADIVTLDRVICCYPDMPALVGASVAHAGHVYGLVYPRNAWWTRMGVWMINLVFRARRHSFRTFVHSPEAVDALVVARGFQRRFRRLTGVWQVVVYART